MTPTYITKLGLTRWKTGIKAQKIDGFPLENYGMTSAKFYSRTVKRRFDSVKKGFC